MLERRKRSVRDGVGGKIIGLFCLRHTDVGMTREVEVESGGAAFRRSDNEKIRLRHRYRGYKRSAWGAFGPIVRVEIEGRLAGIGTGGLQVFAAGG